MRRTRQLVYGLLISELAIMYGGPAAAQTPQGAPDASADAGRPYLSDRGPGIATSMFGTYVAPGERLLYPFYEYTRSSSFQYHPSELGSVGTQDYLGRFTEREALLWFSYGVSDRLSFEVEGAVHSRATFTKAPNDTSGLPARFSESGLGDVEGQVRWRWRAETAERPELYSFVEVVLPSQRSKHLIGTSDWETVLGFGILRGFRWGTIGGRVTLHYDRSDPEAALEPGEYAFDYIKRISPKWRWVASLEGEAEDMSLIGEAQWSFARRAFLKINCGFGVAGKAPDVAPEIGVMIHF
jgi:hypothetical protein